MKLTKLFYFEFLCLFYDFFRWSKIAQHLPGRTDNEIKNYWRTQIQKQVKHLKLDIDRRKFLRSVSPLKTITCQQKSKESSHSITMTIQNQAIHLPFDGVSSSHYSSIGTIPTQVSCKEACMNEGVSNNGLCMSSSKSTNLTQHLGYTTTQIQSLENNEFGICGYDGYYINNNSLNLTTTMVAEDFQISESNWLDKDFVCTSIWGIN